jgi:AcrR family transcriptional regulator
LQLADKVNTFTFVKSKGEQTRQRIVDRALELFEKRGYSDTTLRDIADAAGISIGLTYRYFRRKEELALELYDRLSAEVAARVKVPEGTVADRWAAIEHARFEVLAPHRRTLLALLQVALDPDGELGVMSRATASIRARWHALHESAVTGASNAPADVQATTRLLYAADLLLVLFWTQDRSRDARATHDAVDRIARFLGIALAMPGIAAVAGELATTFSLLTKETSR